MCYQKTVQIMVYFWQTVMEIIIMLYDLEFLLMYSVVSFEWFSLYTFC